MLCVTATRKKHNSSQARKKTHNVVWHHQLITIKTWQLRMHCNVKPPEPRQPFPALITTPCQVWSRWTYPLPYYSVFCCWYITLYPATLTSDFVTFDLQRLHRIACDVIKLWNAELLRFPYLTQWPWTPTVWSSLNVSCTIQHLAAVRNKPSIQRHVTCCARLWNNLRQVWPSTTSPCVNYNIVSTSLHQTDILVTADAWLFVCLVERDREEPTAINPTQQ